MHHRPTVLVSLALLLCGLGAASAATPAASDANPVKETVQTLREGGVALYGWLTANHPPVAEPSEEEPEAYDWTRCSSLSGAEAAETTGLDLPAEDGWGHALEYCVQPENVAGGRYVIGIRSPGGDGSFQDEAYRVGPYDEETAPGTDLVWMDGYFITWPQKKEE